MVNLAPLNQVSLSADRRTTSVGPGNTWGDVYKVLDPLGVSVVGGREAGVGVGGLLLGGKYPISFKPLSETCGTKSS